MAEIRAATPTHLAKNSHSQEAERGGAGVPPTKVWPAVPALWVVSSKENLFLRKGHQGQGQGQSPSVHC